MFRSERIREVIQQLGALGQEVTTWEAEFLEGLRRQRRELSDKQYAVIVRMAECSLGETVAAELSGQQALFGATGEGA